LERLERQPSRFAHGIVEAGRISPAGLRQVGPTSPATADERRRLPNDRAGIEAFRREVAAGRNQDRRLAVRGAAGHENEPAGHASQVVSQAT